jgi:hypothetical protein
MESHRLGPPHISVSPGRPTNTERCAPRRTPTPWRHNAPRDSAPRRPISRSHLARTVSSTSAPGDTDTPASSRNPHPSRIVKLFYRYIKKTLPCHRRSQPRPRRSTRPHRTEHPEASHRISTATDLRHPMNNRIASEHDPAIQPHPRLWSSATATPNRQVFRATTSANTPMQTLPTMR